jgi:uncharacterized protein YcbK (DUF882 family)
MHDLKINPGYAMRLTCAALLIVGILAPPDRAFSVDERRLSFYHTHTHESLEVTYALGGEYIASALDEINDFLADFRTGDATVMDAELLDVIYDVQTSLGSHGTFEVISAYRSPETNEMLRSSSSGVAKNSQHVLGKAIDVRLRDVDTDDLRDAAIKLHRGGVGYYKDSDFVHMDTGRVRRW